MLLTALLGLYLMWSALHHQPTPTLLPTHPPHAFRAPIAPPDFSFRNSSAIYMLNSVGLSTAPSRSPSFTGYSADATSLTDVSTALVLPSYVAAIACNSLSSAPAFRASSSSGQHYVASMHLRVCLTDVTRGNHTSHTCPCYDCISCLPPARIYMASLPQLLGLNPSCSGCMPCPSVRCVIYRPQSIHAHLFIQFTQH
jgi:hypothetical protein